MEGRLKKDIQEKNKTINELQAQIDAAGCDFFGSILGLNFGCILNITGGA